MILRMKKFIYRGPNSFYYKRKRWPLKNLKVEMASKRVTSPGGGGVVYTDEECDSLNIVATTGDGIAWHKDSDRSKKGWFRYRHIKAGQWNGWWKWTSKLDI